MRTSQRLFSTGSVLLLVFVLFGLSFRTHAQQKSATHRRIAFLLAGFKPPNEFFMR